MLRAALLGALCVGSAVIARADFVNPKHCEDDDVRSWKYEVATTDSDARMLTKRGWLSESGTVLAVSSRMTRVEPVAPFPTNFFAVAADTGDEMWRVTGDAAHAPPFHLYDLVASHVMDEVVHISQVQGKTLGVQAYSMTDGSTQGMAFTFGTPCGADEALCRFLILSSASVPGSTTTEQRMVLLHQKTAAPVFSPSNWTSVELVGLSWDRSNGYKQLWHLPITHDGKTPDPKHAVFSPDAALVTFYRTLGNFDGYVYTYEAVTGKFVYGGSILPSGALGIQLSMLWTPPPGAPNKRDVYAIATNANLIGSTYQILRRNSTYKVTGVQYTTSSLAVTGYSNYQFNADGTLLLTMVGDSMCNSTTPGGVLTGGEGTRCLEMSSDFGVSVILSASAFNAGLTRAWAFGVDSLYALEGDHVVAKADLLYTPTTQAAMYHDASDTLVFAASTFHVLMGYKGSCVPGSGTPHSPGLSGGVIALIVIGVCVVVGLGVGWACRRPTAAYQTLPTRPAASAAPQYRQAPPPTYPGGGVPPPQQPMGYPGGAPAPGAYGAPGAPGAYGAAPGAYGAGAPGGYVAPAAPAYGKDGGAV